MPYTISVFLSSSLLYILLGCYGGGYILMGIAFHLYHIQRRFDVLFRAGLMHGTFIFLSHILGAIIGGVWMIGAHSFDMGALYRDYSVTGVSILAAAGIYYMISIYLWKHLAIDKELARKLTMTIYFFVIPWYFLLNLK